MISKKMRKATIKSIMILVLLSISLLLTGCVTEEETVGNLELIGYDHEESYITGNFSSEITFYVSNTGNEPVKSSSIDIQITNQNK